MAANENRSENPLAASVEKLRSELDRWMEVAMTQGGKALNAIGLRSGDRPFVPVVDVVETAEDIFVDVGLPGTPPENIDVTIVGNMLTVRGETPALQTGDDGKVHLNQIHRGKFERSIPLPAPVNADSVSAKSVHGILTVRLAKSERAKSRQIPIVTDSGE
ncbi:MAG: hypothetical protein Tsb009_39860 [Planctomycetaceae bacterium]